MHSTFKAWLCLILAFCMVSALAPFALAAGEEVAEAAPEEAEEVPEAKQTATITFVVDDKETVVAVELTGGWSVEFGADSVYLYDGPNDGERKPIAFGDLIDQREYDENIARHSGDDSFVETGAGVMFSDEKSFCNKQLFAIGNGLFFMIAADQSADAEEIYARFDVKARDTDAAVAEIAAPVHTPEATAAPAPAKPVPTVTKPPYSEKLNEGGSCMFIARADNATNIEWHFVSSDGKTDIAYGAASSYFPKMTVSGGASDTLILGNVPANLSGWSVYCRFGNEAGSVSTASASITVTAVTPAPAPTQEPAPAPEYVPVYPASEYAGTYYAGRATMDIMGGPSSYIVDITWRSSAGEYSEWTFSGTVDSEGVLYYSDCQKTTFTFDENGNEASAVVEYTNGKGCIYSDYTSGMCWDDYEEGIADGVSFTK